MNCSGVVVWTLGHSTRSWTEFVVLLREWELEQVADVRSFPTSRRHPQFEKQNMLRELTRLGLRYHHLPSLGGRRRRSAAQAARSVNQAWRVQGFNAYADHMATAEFQQGLEQLLHLAARHRTVLICAEALPWRCHRWLLSDALVARGVEVLHILGPQQVRKHALSPWARVQGTQVSYPAAPLFDSLGGASRA